VRVTCVSGKLTHPHDMKGKPKRVYIVPCYYATLASPIALFSHKTTTIHPLARPQIMTSIIQNPNLHPPNMPLCFPYFALGIPIGILIAALCCAIYGCGIVLARDRRPGLMSPPSEGSSAYYADDESESVGSDASLKQHVLIDPDYTATTPVRWSDAGH